MYSAAFPWYIGPFLFFTLCDTQISFVLLAAGTGTLSLLSPLQSVSLVYFPATIANDNKQMQIQLRFTCAFALFRSRFPSRPSIAAQPPRAATAAAIVPVKEVTPQRIEVGTTKPSQPWFSSSSKISDRPTEARSALKRGVARYSKQYVAGGKDGLGKNDRVRSA